MANKKSVTAPVGEDIDLDNPEFLRAWELLQYTSQSLFLTGKAGTGKSTFLRYITSHTRKKYVVLAPTGIAAVNAGGQTLHSFFRLPFKPVLADDPEFARDRLRERMKYPSWLVKLIREVELIIIDEISMVRADTIDFIDRLLRFYTRNDRVPFGGKQMLLVGDIFQLEPVVTADMREILRLHYRNFYFFSAKAFGNLRLVPIELRKVYRQTDGEFISLLDRIRTGNATRNDIMRLNSRCHDTIADDGDSTSEGKFTMTLATRRDMVDHINETRLKAIARPTVTFTGIVRGDFPDNSLPTDLELALKEGAQVVFIRNDADHRWVNGTIGRVSALAGDLLEVTLENGQTHELKPEIWSNVKYTYDSETKKIKEEELGSFTQYPVKLAWALTVHKSQGLTFNDVIIDMGRGAFAGGQTYVALSRCRSFEGMVLKSTIAERDVFINPAIIEFSRTFNDDMLIDGALAKAHADSCYAQAARLADSGDLVSAFDKFAEGMGSRSVLDDPLAMRLARRKLGVAGRLRARIAELENIIAENRERFAEMAAEYTSLGDDCRQDDMPVPAIANYDKALSLMPGHRAALRGRALSHAMLGDHIAALDDFRQLMELDPCDVGTMVAMACSYYLTDDLHNAMDRCMAAEELCGEVECSRSLRRTLHSLMADIYGRLGDEGEASAHRDIASRLS